MVVGAGASGAATAWGHRAVVSIVRIIGPGRSGAGAEIHAGRGMMMATATIGSQAGAKPIIQSSVLRLPSPTWAYGLRPPRRSHGGNILATAPKWPQPTWRSSPPPPPVRPPAADGGSCTASPGRRRLLASGSIRCGVMMLPVAWRWPRRSAGLQGSRRTNGSDGSTCSRCRPDRRRLVRGRRRSGMKSAPHWAGRPRHPV